MDTYIIAIHRLQGPDNYDSQLHEKPDLGEQFVETFDTQTVSAD